MALKYGMGRLVLAALAVKRGCDFQLRVGQVR